jgi:hypothetical protein
MIASAARTNRSPSPSRLGSLSRTTRYGKRQKREVKNRGGVREGERKGEKRREKIAILRPIHISGTQADRLRQSPSFPLKIRVGFKDDQVWKEGQKIGEK